MASRDEQSYDGLDFHASTYKADGSGDIVFDATKDGGSAVVGKAVMLTGDGLIRLTADGVRVLGQLHRVESDGMCSVQDEGFIDPPGGEAATLTQGAPFVGALLVGGLRGGVRAIGASGAAYAEAAADDTQNGRGQIVNNANTAKVVCKL
jgi:hypothetical protein